MSSTHILVHDPRRARLWGIARWSALLAVPALLVWLVVQSAPALTVLWYVAIPVLPATFFLNPVLWRSVCPLATLNEWGNRLAAQRPLPARTAQVLGIAGLVLFHLMVPARRFVFNQNGPALAATVVTVGALALALGAVYAVRSGFCNALCPVLPVELLYGQAPLLRMTRGRCSTCTTCTPRGCLDLAQGRALRQLLGPSRRPAEWLWQPRGFFVAALPGFVIGYSLLADGPLSTAPTVYATTLGWSVGSFVVVAALVTAFRLQPRWSLPAIAAAAGLLYYWFAGPAVSRALGAGEPLSLAIRLVGMALVAVWLIHSWSARAGARWFGPTPEG